MNLTKEELKIIEEAVITHEEQQYANEGMEWQKIINELIEKLREANKHDEPLFSDCEALAEKMLENIDHDDLIDEWVYFKAKAIQKDKAMFTRLSKHYEEVQE